MWDMESLQTRPILKRGNPEIRTVTRKGQKTKNPLVKLDQFNQLFSQSIQAIVSLNGETEEPPRMVYLTLLEKLKGRAFEVDLKALQFLIKTSHQIDYTECCKNKKVIEKMHDYKFIMNGRVKEKEYKDYSIDHILPHPDHVHIDLKRQKFLFEDQAIKRKSNYGIWVMLPLEIW